MESTEVDWTGVRNKRSEESELSVVPDIREAISKNVA
jgi:hypothetical protein